MFIALAILEKHREVIMEHLKHFDEVLKYVNELANTIDLNSTLLRAQQLFRRFQRTVEAVDKRHNFPAPTVRQRKPAEGERPASKGKSSATGADAAGSSSGGVGGAVAQGIGAEKEKVISPELRALLKREVEVLDKLEIRERGGGV